MPNLVRFALPFVLLGIVACDGDGGTETPGPGTQQSGGPKILSFAPNTTKLADVTDQLIISAVLTDEHGVDDIIGGQLFDADSGAAYGSFMTSAQEGAYQITLTWAQLTQSHPDVPGEWNTPVVRNLKAKFFDQAGHEATQTLTIDLACSEEDGTVVRVTKMGCRTGAECSPTFLPGPKPGCGLLPEAATGAEACAAWNGSSCVNCVALSPAREIGCNTQGPSPYGTNCECN